MVCFLLNDVGYVLFLFLSQILQSGDEPESVYRVIKMLKQRPANWAECVARSRKEFEKYYNHKVSVF